jgi:hypothetical protein
VRDPSTGSGQARLASIPNPNSIAGREKGERRLFPPLSKRRVARSSGPFDGLRASLAEGVINQSIPLTKNPPSSGGFFVYTVF